MRETPQIATGPVILERLIAVEAKIDHVAERIDEAIRAVERRYQLIDQFIDPALNLDGSIKQLISVYERQFKALRAELQDMRGALALHLGAEDLARERGG